MIDVYIDDVRLGTLGWIRESMNFPVPKPEINTIVVPGRNSPIRYTETFGRVSYEPRTFDITLSRLCTRKDFDESLAELTNRFSGKLCKIKTTENLNLYVLGTIIFDAEYDPLAGKGIVVISSEDADSYKYHAEETIVRETGNKVVVLTNDFMPVVPKVTVTSETSLSWKVGEDTFHKTMSAGTFTFPELELSFGDNEITLETDGEVTFSYREGRL